jgi:hypothetical protein
MCLTAGLAGCAVKPAPDAMDVHPPAASFSPAEAVVFIDADRRAENIIFHRSFRQVLQFQNVTLLAHPRLRADGSVVPDVFTTRTRLAPSEVVEPGRYVLHLIADLNESQPLVYRFDLNASPVSFEVQAGETADLGRIVFHNEDASACSNSGKPCDSLLSVRLEPHSAEERADMLAHLRRDYPAANVNLAIRPPTIERSPVAMMAVSGRAYDYVSQ